MVHFHRIGVPALIGEVQHILAARILMLHKFQMIHRALIESEQFLGSLRRQSRVGWRRRTTSRGKDGGKQREKSSNPHGGMVPRLIFSCTDEDRPALNATGQPQERFLYWACRVPQTGRFHPCQLSTPFGAQ